MVDKLKQKIQDVRRTSMIRAEWRHLAGDKLLAVSMAVMAFIPIMYGGFFLGGIWDPYGNTKNLTVAVVNEDTGATIGGQRQNLGEKTVEKLRDNHDLNWQFMSRQESESCLEDTICYMAITIPTDFSANAATVTQSDPKPSTLTYTLTPARNYIGALLTEQAAKHIEQSVSRELSQAYVSAMLDGLSQIGDGMEQASQGAAQLHDGASALSRGINTYTSGVTTLTKGQHALDSGLRQLQSGSSTLRGGLEQVNMSLPSPTQIQQLQQGTQQIQQGVTALNSALQTPSPELVQLQSTLSSHSSTLVKDLQLYQAAATAASDALTRVGTSVQVAAAGNQATVTLSTADMAQLLGLVNQSRTITQHSGELLTTLGTFETTLTSQQQILRTNVAQLNTGVNQFVPGAQRAFGGYTTLQMGSSQLTNGARSLEQGLSSAARGSSQLVDGSSQLDANNSALTNGAARLADGSQTLADKLAEAARQVTMQPTGASTAKHIVSPIDLDKNERGNVPNYGYALAPYVLSLGLFVGAFVFNVIYPIRRTFGSTESPLKWWAAKASMGLVVALSQALVLDGIMIWGLGLHPDHLGQFIGISLLTSVTYMSIVMLLSISLDNVGRFLAMLLLVLQLGAAGGTFPIQTAPEFFRAINPVLPMTHSVYAFRESISSGLGNSLYIQSSWILVGFAIAANLLLIVFLWRHGNKAFRHASVDG